MNRRHEATVTFHVTINRCTAQHFVTIHIGSAKLASRGASTSATSDDRLTKPSFAWRNSICLSLRPQRRHRPGLRRLSAVEARAARSERLKLRRDTRRRLADGGDHSLAVPRRRPHTRPPTEIAPTRPRLTANHGQQPYPARQSRQPSTPTQHGSASRHGQANPPGRGRSGQAGLKGGPPP